MPRLEEGEPMFHTIEIPETTYKLTTTDKKQMERWLKIETLLAVLTDFDRFLKQEMDAEEGINSGAMPICAIREKLWELLSDEGIDIYEM